MSVVDRDGWLVLAAQRGCGVVMALLLTGCSLVPTFPGGTRDVSELVPVAALQIHGRYLDGHLEVRGPAWRIVLQRAEQGSAEDDRPAGSVTARLVDGAGMVLAERHTLPAGGPEGDAARDAEEEGAFGLLLTTDRPADAVMLQVEAEGHLHEEHLGEQVRVRLGEVPSASTEPLDVAITTDAPPAAIVTRRGRSASTRTSTGRSTVTTRPTAFRSCTSEPAC